MSDLVEDIKNKLSIEQVVSPYVEMKRAGRNFKACCPFHAEKTPSFVISVEKQLAYCFGCHKGGDIFSFIQEVEGLDFKGAVNFLAEKAGIDTSFYKESKTDFVGAPKSQKERIVDLMEQVTRFFQKKLEAEEANPAKNYLLSRGINPEDIKKFRLGYAPDSFDETYSYLLNLGFSKEEIILSGMGVVKDTGSERIYDRFRHRIMYPIFSHNGEVIAFGGRVIRPEDEPKYLNSPETILYKKASTLYGFKFARTAIKTSGYVVVVEGYMDVIASHRAGINNVVASSGTALSEKQGQILKRLITDFRLCFDSDSAGIAAARRAVEVLQPLDVSLKIISLKEAKDPDELIVKNADLWLKNVENAQNYFDFFLNNSLKNFTKLSLEERKTTLRDLLHLVKGVKSALEKDEYVRKLATFFQTRPEIIYSELKDIKSFNTFGGNSSLKPNKNVELKPDLGSYFLGLIMNTPQLISYLQEEAMEYQNYLSEAQKNVYLNIVNLYNDDANFANVLDSLVALKEEEKKRLSLLALYAEEKNSLLNEDLYLAEFKEVCKKLKENNRKQRINELKLRLKNAVQQGEDDKEIAKELNELIKY